MNKKLLFEIFMCVILLLIMLLPNNPPVLLYYFFTNWCFVFWVRSDVPKIQNCQITKRNFILQLYSPFYPSNLFSPHYLISISTTSFLYVNFCLPLLVLLYPLLHTTCFSWPSYHDLLVTYVQSPLSTMNSSST